MRCVFGPKKVRQLRKSTGLPVVGALCRGGTGHRIDLLLEDHRCVSLFRNGEIWDYGEHWQDGKKAAKEDE